MKDGQVAGYNQSAAGLSTLSEASKSGMTGGRGTAVNTNVDTRLVDEILGALPAAVVLIDEKQKILHSNDNFHKLAGRSAAECNGLSLTDVIDREMLGRAISKAIVDIRASHSVEFRHRLNDHETLCSADVIPMSGQRALVIINDITSERERQERLYLTDRLASIGEMVSGVAHELNNPLTSVIGLTQLLLESRLSPHIHQDLQDIYSEAQRAAAIVKNLLSFGRKRAPVRQMTQINNIIREVLNLRAHEHRVNNITVITSLDPDLPELFLDHFQMQQVFLNIILNAENAMADITHERMLTVTTQTTDYSVRTILADNGPGIPPGLLSRIFDPFFTTKEVGKGTGLGLSICYGIVNAHGGVIFADSKRKQGAAFIIELPRTQHPLFSNREGEHALS